MFTFVGEVLGWWYHLGLFVGFFPAEGRGKSLTHVFTFVGEVLVIYYSSFKKNVFFYLPSAIFQAQSHVDRNTAAQSSKSYA